MSELDDPMRIFDRDPRRAVKLLVNRQLELLEEAVSIQQQLTSMFENPHLLGLLPEEMRADPVNLGRMLAAFTGLTGVLRQYQFAILSFATLFLEKEDLLNLTKRFQRK